MPGCLRRKQFEIKQFSLAKTHIRDLEEIGKKEHSLWFEWHAIELAYLVHRAEGIDTSEDQILRTKCLE